MIYGLLRVAVLSTDPQFVDIAEVVGLERVHHWLRLDARAAPVRRLLLHRDVVRPRERLGAELHLNLIINMI